MDIKHLKIKAVTILKEVDNIHFAEAIKKIEKVTLKTNDKFAYNCAQAEIMYYASAAISPNYYKRLSSKKQLKLQRLFRDGIGEQLNGEVITKEDFLNSPRELNYRYIEEHGIASAYFLQTFANITDKISIDEKQILIQKIPATDSRFGNLIQVEQEEYVLETLEKGMVIGATGLATCVSIGLLGVSGKGQFKVSVGHYSTPTIEDIKQQAEDLIEEHQVEPQSLKLYMVGGCIETLPNAMNLARQAKAAGINISFMNIGSVDIEAGGESGMAFSLNAQNQPVFYYATTYNPCHNRWYELAKLLPQLEEKPTVPAPGKEQKAYHPLKAKPANNHDNCFGEISNMPSPFIK